MSHYSLSRYLNREKVMAGESYIFWYSWGPRAEQEVGKRELLALVAEVTHHITITELLELSRELVQCP